MIIGISGFIGVGKDTVAELLRQENFYNVVAFADELKRIVMRLFDFPEEHLWGPSALRSIPDERYPMPGGGFLTPRHALQTLGTEWGRSCYPLVWCELALRIAGKLERQEGIYRRAAGFIPGSFNTAHSGVVIPDCRFINEFEEIRKKGGKVVRIKRKGLEEPSTTHASELEQASVPDSFFDYVLHNDADESALPGKVGDMLDVLRPSA